MTRGESMDNTEAIRVLKSFCGNFTSEDLEALSLAVQALKPLPTLEELERVIESHQIGKRFIIEHDKDLPTAEMITNLATAILDLLKGER